VFTLVDNAGNRLTANSLARAVDTQPDDAPALSINASDALLNASEGLTLNVAVLTTTAAAPASPSAKAESA